MTNAPTDRINRDTVHAVLHKLPPPAPAPPPSSASRQPTVSEGHINFAEDAATKRFIRDVKAALVSEGGMPMDKQRDLERRIEVIEKTVGIGSSSSSSSSSSAQMQIESLQRQLSLARAAIQALSSQQDEHTRRASQDFKRR